MDKDELQLRLRDSEDIPMLDRTARNILDILHSDTVYPEKVFHAIQTDAVLAAKILKVANSPLYRRGEPTDTLQRAVTLLGVTRTLNLALGFSIQSMGEGSRSGIDQKRFWKKGILAGWMAMHSRNGIEGINIDALYLACLLQDIGVMAMRIVLGKSYDTLFSHAKSHFDLVALELRNWGIDHAEAGAVLAEEWALPPSIVSAIGSSHQLMGGTRTDESSLEHWVAVLGMEADLWLGDVTDSQCRAVEAAIQENPILIQEFHTAAEAVPAAEAMFDMSLLSNECIEAASARYLTG